jgi:flagellar basal-body rod protein FlgC
LSDIYEIAASGMSAQRTQMDVIAENLANAGVVRADGSVFRPKTAVLQSSASFEPVLHDAMAQAMPDSFLAEDADSTEPGGLALASIVEEAPEPQYKFDPGNPYAAKSGSHKGYVALPDVDPISQMVALVASGRAYDADVSMLQTAKQMDLEAADINRA